MAQASTTSVVENQSILKKLFAHTEVIILLSTIALMFASHIANNAFFSQYNMSTMLRQMSFVTIIAVGQTMILIMGDIDLSVGAVACFTAIITGTLMTTTGLNPYLVMPIGLVIGGLCGAFNVFFITRFKITPFIVTLASSQIFTGLVYVITEGRPVMNIPASFTILGQGMIGGVIPIPLIFMLLIVALFYFILKYTPFGRHVYAIGGNTTAARLVGIRVNSTRSAVYIITGMLAAFAGMLMMARLGIAQPTVGVNWVMPTITAAVLGGTSMSGGRGGVIGTLIGALLTNVISNAIVMMRISTYMEQVVIGSVVIIAVLIDAIRTMNSKK